MTAEIPAQDRLVLAWVAKASRPLVDLYDPAVARGVLDDLHGTMISAKEAEISLHLVGTIRNKLLDAFHEIWRTSV